MANESIPGCTAESTIFVPVQGDTPVSAAPKSVRITRMVFVVHGEVVLVDVWGRQGEIE